MNCNCESKRFFISQDGLIICPDCNKIKSKEADLDDWVKPAG